jgi:hypothetical protein
LRDPIRNQSSDRRAAGMVGTEHLPEEDPKRHQGREDPVVPSDLDRLQGLRQALFGEDLGEGKVPFLEELLSNPVDLTPKTSVAGVSHRSASEPVREVGTDREFRASFDREDGATWST